MLKKYYRVGEIFSFKDINLVVVEAPTCKGCIFKKDSPYERSECSELACTGFSRFDERSVIFKKIAWIASNKEKEIIILLKISLQTKIDSFIKSNTNINDNDHYRKLTILLSKLEELEKFLEEY